MAKQPLAEVFGFPIDNLSSDADRYRKNKNVLAANNII